MRALIGRPRVVQVSRRALHAALALTAAAVVCACGGKTTSGASGEGAPDGSPGMNDEGGVMTVGDASVARSDGGAPDDASLPSDATSISDTGAPTVDASEAGFNPATPPAGVISGSSLSAFEADGVVAVASDGTTAVAWLADPSAENPSVQVIGYTFWTPGAAAWTPVQTTTGAPNQYVGDPTITVDGSGNFYVGWLELTNGSQGTTGAVPHVWVASAPAGATTFGAPVIVSDPSVDATASLDDRPWLSVTDSGTVLVSYNTFVEDSSGNTSGSTLFVARSTDQGATWARSVVPSTGFTAFLCAPKTGTRTYLVDVEGAQGFDPGAGDAGGPTILGVRWSDDDGVSWPGSNLSIMASGTVEAPSCVSDGPDVWVAYGDSTGDLLGYLDESVHVARLSNQGTRLVADVNATAHESLPLFYVYQLGFGPSGRLDLFYYAGEDDGDLNASYRHSYSTDTGTTWTASDDVYSPVLLTNVRHEKLWLGDWIGIADHGNTVYTTFVENELPDGVSHVAFQTIPESSAPDGGVVPPVDAGTLPAGTQLVQSMSTTLWGVTADGFAVYTDKGDGSSDVVPLAGGEPTKIAAAMSTGSAGAAGTIAYAFASFDLTTSAGPLTVWTAAHGPVTVGDGRVFEGYFGNGGQLAASADASEIIYIENATATTGDIAVSATDGTSTTVLVSGVRFDVPGCYPEVGFAGALAVAEYCSSSTGNAAYPATLATFAGPTWTATAISSAAAYGFSIDPSGTRATFGDAAGMEAAVLATGPTTLVDANGFGGLFTSDGSHLVYTTNSGTIAIAPTDASVAPTVLQASGGYAGLLALSPDNSWALGYKGYAQTGNAYTTDLYLVPATTAGTVTTLSSATTALVAGSAFTTDSGHALFLTGVASGAGTFTMVATATGAVQTFGSGTNTTLAAAGGAVLFNANSGAQSEASSSSGDIELLGTDGSAASLLVTQADAPFYLSPSLDAVVYSWSFLPGASGGIWVEEIP